MLPVLFFLLSWYILIVEEGVCISSNVIKKKESTNYTFAKTKICLCKSYIIIYIYFHVQ